MSDLNNIVDVTISRETQTVSQAGFGTPAIISQFTTAKTVTTFVRHRFYASLTEMSTDGWGATDLEYKAAQVMFAQNPKPASIMIGRWDSGDANLTAALNAIQIANQDWYAMILIATKTAEVTVDIDFVTGNSIVFTINGTAVTAVPWSTDQQTTMGALKTQIEADIANSTVTVGGSPYRTMTIVIDDETPSSITVVTTGGATQPVATFGYDDTGVEQVYKDTAAWAETMVKLFGFTSSDSGIIGSGAADIASFMKGLNYDRTFVAYHTSSNVDQTPTWFASGWFGRILPKDPGSVTWAYKTIAGIAAYSLTSAERTNALGKNANIYTVTAGVSNTETGQVASGEYIDIIRGLDWLTARIQEAIFTQLINQDKIPFTDEGITLIVNTLSGVLDEGAAAGLLVGTSIVITAPKAADVSITDKGNRFLPDVNFAATLQGAIHNVDINGVVTV